jgi:hypothetical protein
MGRTRASFKYIFMLTNIVYWYQGHHPTTNTLYTVSLLDICMIHVMSPPNQSPRPLQNNKNVSRSLVSYFGTHRENCALVDCQLRRIRVSRRVHIYCIYCHTLWFWNLSRDRPRGPQNALHITYRTYEWLYELNHHGIGFLFKFVDHLKVFTTP